MDEYLEIVLDKIRNKIPKITLLDNVEVETFDTYDFQHGLWIPKISITNDKELIKNSNHFIDLIIDSDDRGQENGYYPHEITRRRPHKIYSRIVDSYLNIVNKNNDAIVINDKCIYLHNSFSTGNAGHDLFCMLSTLMKHCEDPEIKFILFDEIDTNSNNYKIIKLFITDDRIIKIKQGIIYNFKRQIFNHEKGEHRVFWYHDIINKTLSKLKVQHDNLLTTDLKDNLKNRKVIIIKNSNQESIVRRGDCFNANILFEYLTTNNWIIINPEKMDFYEMTYILMNAKVIITGERGISCCNQIFYNLGAQIIAFLVNYDNNLLYFGNTTFLHHDDMCNDYYYNSMKQAILSPIDITHQNVEEFKNLNIN
jgi:hypothetical protein